MKNDEYTWTDNPTVSGVSPCNTDVLNECLMHLKYDNEGSGSGFSLFDVVPKDHVLSPEESKGFAPLGSYVYKEPVSSVRYGYPDFYAKCLEEKADGVEVEMQLGENTITVYKNMNGHVFYDIADKDAVDFYYTYNGACWMYGVDTENERIFLPRNDWFTQNGSTTDVGKFVAAGLPNITGTFNNEINMVRSSTGAFSLKNQVAYYATGQTKYNDLYQTVEINASDSNTIYGNSDTVQPAAVKKIMYMVVGSTEVTSSIIDVEEVTTSENDTIPLFTAQYFNFTPNNPSWLKAGTQKNSGGIYTTAYNTLVACLTDNTYNIKVVDTANMTAGVDYSEYWKVDQTAMTFTTPTKIGNEGIFGNVPVVGNGMALGLTDGINNAGAYYSLTNHDIGAEQRLYGTTVGSTIASFEQFLANNKALSVTSDPEKSGLITDTSGVEIPEGWGLYFKVANAVQNLELLDAGEVLEAVANKVDMANTQWAVNACMPAIIPDYTAVVTVSSPYTAPKAGFILWNNTGLGNCTVNGDTVYIGGNDASNEGPAMLLLGSGDVISFTPDAGSPCFIPMKGANNA